MLHSDGLNRSNAAPPRKKCHGSSSRTDHQNRIRTAAANSRFRPLDCRFCSPFDEQRRPCNAFQLASYFIGTIYFTHIVVNRKLAIFWPCRIGINFLYFHRRTGSEHDDHKKAENPDAGGLR